MVHRASDPGRAEHPGLSVRAQEGGQHVPAAVREFTATVHVEALVETMHRSIHRVVAQTQPATDLLFRVALQRSGEYLLELRGQFRCIRAGRLYRELIAEQGRQFVMRQVHQPDGSPREAPVGGSAV